MKLNHQNNFATNLSSNTLVGATTSPVNSVPSVAAPFYVAYDATNINGKFEVARITSKTATNLNHAALTYAHTTDEEIRLVLSAEEANDINSYVMEGWTSVPDTWTYASASTITVPSGAASLYQKGDKIKLTNSTTKYFVITNVADTVLTVTGGTDYTVANTTISSVYVSKAANPQGFPGYFNWTPTYGANGSMTFTSVTTNLARFTIKGNMLSFNIFASGTVGGTPNTALSFTAPVTPVSATDYYLGTGCAVVNGTGISGICLYTLGTFYVNLYNTANWAAGAPRQFMVNFSYQI